MVQSNFTRLIVVCPWFVSLVERHQQSCYNPEDARNTRKEDRDDAHDLMVVGMNVKGEILHDLKTHM